MEKFTLEIELGNDAMSSPRDVSKALEEIARDLRRNGFCDEGGGVIRDVNGNKVGTWGYQATPDHLPICNNNRRRER